MQALFIVDHVCLKVFFFSFTICLLLRQNDIGPKVSYRKVVFPEYYIQGLMFLLGMLEARSAGHPAFVSVSARLVGITEFWILLSIEYKVHQGRISK